MSSLMPFVRGYLESAGFKILRHEASVSWRTNCSSDKTAIR